MEATKPAILYLAHRIPFPPNKGDKITTFNLLKKLAEDYRVYLGCFIDDPYDRQYIGKLDDYCAGVKCVDICDRGQLASGLKGLLSGEAVSIAHYRSDELQGWVDQSIAEQDIDKLFIYCAAMSRFVDGPRYSDKKRVLDMADIDSDKWRQYAENKPFYSAWIYRREQRLVADYEQKITKDFDAVTLITEQETAAYRKMLPAELGTKVFTVGNGVDTAYFDPAAATDEPLQPITKSPSLCFTGAMDYWANVDAVVWFVENVWPLLIKAQPDLHFYIVGGKPSDAVQALAVHKQVIVTGRVPDVRPYVNAAALVVAPLRIARGVQNKVLEAMSLAKPVVMTPMAQEGIELPEPQKSLVVDGAEQTAALVLKLLDEEVPGLGQLNRQWILDRYSWSGALAPLDEIL